MSMYGDVLNKLDDGLFVKFDPGRPVKLRLLDHAKVSRREFAGGDVSVRFAWPVWDYDQSRVRILEQGKSIFEQIGNIIEAYPNGMDMPSPFDITVTRTGTGQFDTKYSVVNTPYVSGCPVSNELELPEIKGMPLAEVVAGELPPLVQAGQQSGAPALGSGDNTPTDDDVNKVNLDEIPF